jgi:hypothetical protein
MTSASVDWLGLPNRFLVEPPQIVVGRSADAPACLTQFLTADGGAVAKEETRVELWRDAAALRCRATCFTASMKRVREIVAGQGSYERDHWGLDAIEIQIDVGRTCDEYFHLILPPTGRAVTFLGHNNRDVQGSHPVMKFTATLHADRWVVELELPFTSLGRTPRDGEVWGLNVMRTNPDESGNHVQWAPTFGSASRPELFGTLAFARRSKAPRRAAEVARYQRRAQARHRHFLEHIHRLSDQDVWRALNLRGEPDFTRWSEYLAHRAAPLPVRWDEIATGAEGVTASDRPELLAEAEQFCGQVDNWIATTPMDLSQLEKLGAAYLLTRERRYAEVLDRAILGHAAHVEKNFIPLAHPSPRLYHDFQVILNAQMAYAYLSARTALAFSPAAHAAVLRTVLRSARSSAFNITECYNGCNHQIFEAVGLGLLALLFPEFKESDDWAQIASRTIARHYALEVGADGGYQERCGYHTVAMSFVMQLVISIRANRAGRRFPALMNPATRGRLKKMTGWLLEMTTPDGALPAFGDYGAYSQVRYFRQAWHLFRRPELAWPVQQNDPGLLPAGTKVVKPKTDSVSLPVSNFTIMRSGRKPGDFYMVVDHGPMGGQHSHVDNLGFVAYAHGAPFALDGGISNSYNDPRYLGWFRQVQAHNTVVVDDAQPEKVSERLFWKSFPEADFLWTRSRGYEFSHGVIHERSIIFVKMGLWFMFDRLRAKAGGHVYDWRLHTPMELKPRKSGRYEGRASAGQRGLVVLAANPDQLQTAPLEFTPCAVPLPEAPRLRQLDCRRRYTDRLVADLPSFAVRQQQAGTIDAVFPMVLLPFRGKSPSAKLTASPDGTEFQLQLENDIELTFLVSQYAHGARCRRRGRTLWSHQTRMPGAQ